MSFTIERRLKIEDSQRRVLILSFGDHVATIRRRRKSVSKGNPSGPNNRRDQNRGLEITNIVDVVAACTTTVKPVGFGVGMIANVHVVVTTEVIIIRADRNGSHQSFVGTTLDNVAKIVDMSIRATHGSE